MGRFPLLKYPRVVQEEILREIDPCILAATSFFSTRFKNLLSNVKIQTVSITYKINFTCIAIELKSDKWSLLIEVGQFQERYWLRRWKVNRIPIESRIMMWDDVLRKIWYQCPLRSISEHDALENLDTHLRSFLRVEKSNVIIRNDMPELLDFFFWKKSLKFDKIIVGDQFKEGGLHYRTIEMAPEHLKFLEETTPNELHLNVRTFPNQQYQIAEPIRKIHLLNPAMMDLPNVLQTGIESIKCQVDQNQIELINQVIRKWVQGENQQLERLEFHTEEGCLLCPGLLASVERELQPQFNSEETIQIFGLQPQDTIFEIARATDGRRAALVLNDRKIQILVWTDRRIAELQRLRT
ncbi:hypothetical protein L3Y34_016385 [Caenorhabditis briggsae]|uniref:F-box domain-containing protein n=1 Tax=Caenorhabditis briggsae TaxID=6238 RepID=A0AAE9J0F4_CAEBR|nr:hypothetical protein L3Y34_016385 [Caenorhabditis briggsae]